MLAHHRAVGLADALEAGEIFLLVDHIPGHAHDVLGAAVGFGQHVDDVLQRLPRLSGEVLRLEDLGAGPADMAAEPDGAPLGEDAVGIADGLLPRGGVQLAVDCHSYSPSWVVFTRPDSGPAMRASVRRGFRSTR